MTAINVIGDVLVRSDSSQNRVYCYICMYIRTGQRCRKVVVEAFKTKVRSYLIRFFTQKWYCYITFGAGQRCRKVVFWLEAFKTKSRQPR